VLDATHSVVTLLLIDGNRAQAALDIKSYPLKESSTDFYTRAVHYGIMRSRFIRHGTGKYTD